jgi:Methyltransferase domain
MADDKLFQYYERQDVLPTFGNFKSPAELEAYAAQRQELFSGKLMLPTRLFRDAEVLHFGPDSGENALVFARWGASLTLAEPHLQAHATIKTYFARFGLSDRLRELALSDVEGFRSDRRFDIVDAEGFIYTIQPSEKWLHVFRQLLNADGYAVVSYYERYGGFFELALKAIHAAAKALTGQPPFGAAKFLFEAKWDSIPHTRSFASWVMDVLENPFVRHRYFIDATELCRTADRIGFDAHAGWPSYRDTLGVYWHKKVLPNEEKLRRTLSHLRRSRLSFLGGRKLYLVGPAEDVDWISSTCEKLTLHIDALIDDPFGEGLTRVISSLKSLQKTVAATDILADDEADIEAFSATLDSFFQIFSAIRARDPDGLAALTRTDTAFINCWGLPTHFLVLRKRSEPAKAES